MYAEYTQLQLTFLTLVPWLLLFSLDIFNQYIEVWWYKITPIFLLSYAYFFFNLSFSKKSVKSQFLQKKKNVYLPVSTKLKLTNTIFLSIPHSKVHCIIIWWPKRSLKILTEVHEYVLCTNKGRPNNIHWGTLAWPLGDLHKFLIR